MSLNFCCPFSQTRLFQLEQWLVLLSNGLSKASSYGDTRSIPNGSIWQYVEIFVIGGSGMFPASAKNVDSSFTPQICKGFTAENREMWELHNLTHWSSPKLPTTVYVLWNTLCKPSIWSKCSLALVLINGRVNYFVHYVVSYLLGQILSWG